MTLNVNNQLTLLHDILEEHQADCCGDVSEYQQIKRLVKSIMANNSVENDNLLQLLPEIYNYGLQGENVQSLEEHITSNKSSIHNWMSAIQEISTE